VLEGFQNASRIPELRKRLLFTFAMLAVYRVGVAIPTPGIDGKALAAFFESVQNSVLGLVNLFSGGALEQFSIFALGIMPTSALRSSCS
jgi:preprotein translocase subunit SecY